MELKQSCVLVLLSLTAVVSLAQCASISNEIQEEWNAFKSKYNKNYNSLHEEKLRMRIYIHNRNMIADHNKLFENGETSFQLGVNKYADMTQDEFVKQMNGLNFTLSDEMRGQNELHEYSENETLPKVVDWRKKGYVTPVKDQSACGSCWAFSATGSLEGQHYRKFKKLVSLSEQNLVDCSKKFKNHGCEGGLMDNAFKYIKHNHGLDTESAYPYEAVDDVCRFKPKKVGATLKGFKDVPQGNEKALQNAAAKVGPISVGIDARADTFRFYESGIYYEPACSPTKLDHGVLVVGYGTQKHHDYWLVKNSWGNTWGDNGYIKMSRNRDNNCGIATVASYPVV